MNQIIELGSLLAVVFIVFAGLGIAGLFWFSTKRKILNSEFICLGLKADTVQLQPEIKAQKSNSL